MKAWPIRSDRVSLAVTETGAHLSDVRFTLDDGRSAAPMHTSPWEHESLPADLPPILRVLRGDFFCAPFADSNVIPTETRAHGLPANGNWDVVEQTPRSLDLRLEGDVALRGQDQPSRPDRADRHGGFDDLLACG